MLPELPPVDAPWLVLGTDGKLTDGVDGLIFLSSFGAAAADGVDATAGVLADELPPPLPSPLLEPLLARAETAIVTTFVDDAAAFVPSVAIVTPTVYDPADVP